MWVGESWKCSVNMTDDQVILRLCGFLYEPAQPVSEAARQAATHPAPSAGPPFGSITNNPPTHPGS